MLCEDKKYTEQWDIAHKTSFQSRPPQESPKHQRSSTDSVKHRVVARKDPHSPTSPGTPSPHVSGTSPAQKNEDGGSCPTTDDGEGSVGFARKHDDLAPRATTLEEDNEVGAGGPTVDNEVLLISVLLCVVILLTTWGAVLLVRDGGHCLDFLKKAAFSGYGRELGKKVPRSTAAAATTGAPVADRPEIIQGRKTPDVLIMDGRLAGNPNKAGNPVSTDKIKTFVLGHTHASAHV